jgi:hypothetical protein
VLEKLHSGANLDAQDGVVKTKGLMLIVKDLHDKVDAPVAEAHGGPTNLTDDETDDESLARLAASNAERAEEEKRGQVCGLRPDHRRARTGLAAAPARPKEEQKEEQIDAPAIAAIFRHGQKVTPLVSRIHAAWGRLGWARRTGANAFAPRRRM